MSAQPRIEEALSQYAAAYRLPVIDTCELCGLTFQTQKGADAHREDHALGIIRHGPIIRYYVTRAYLERFCKESKDEIWKRRA